MMEEIVEEYENNDEGEWIGLDNLEQKINTKLKVSKINPKDENVLNVYLHTADFTVQNVALKMGIPVLGVDGMQIRKIKNYILKCYSCYFFNFETNKQFCENCGYTTLMKIGYSVNLSGKVKIYDKEAEARNRGTQFDLPKPTLDKRAAIVILSEDQVPRKKNQIDVHKDLDKILDNYESYKDLLNKEGKFKNYNSSKNFVWGYPKQNPNSSKKYYSKKQKK